MGLTNIYTKYLIAGLLLCASVCRAQVTTTTIPGQLKIKTVPNTVVSGDSLVTIDASGNIKKIAKAVQSVSGTANRVTSTGGLNPVIDISASYTGQSSITTLGTIVSGVWHGTPIGDTWIASAATWNAKQSALTFNSGLTNTSGTVIWGGTILANTILNNGGFAVGFNQPAGGSAHILELYNNGGIVETINQDGRFYGNGLSNLAGGDLGLVQTLTSGVAIRRNNADASPTSASALTVINSNIASKGSLLFLNDPLRNLYSVSSDGSVFENAFTQAVGGTGVNHNISTYLQPSANNDGLVALKIAPVFGTSKIAALGTISGGSGYPNTFNALLMGGTGFIASATCTAASGAVTSVTIVNAGINYTAGDVLAITAFDSNGNPVGTGATVTVSTVTAYTGTTNVDVEFDTAPVRLHSITTPTNFLDGMVWNDGTHFYGYVQGVKRQLDRQTGSTTVLTFATLPTGIEGMMIPISDSNTNTWGATVAGGGSFHILCYYDGTNWTCMAK